MNNLEAQEQVEYEGVQVRIGNRQWVMPSLSVGQAERYWPQLLNLDQTGVSADEVKQLMPAKFDDMVTIIHAALSRNYKDLTAQQLKDMVSIGQLRQLMMIVMGQSGFDQSAGEPQPAEARRVVH